MEEFKHSPAVAAAPSAAMAQDPPTPAAAIRFAWTVCVPHQAETMSFDGFLTMARKVYLVRQPCQGRCRRSDRMLTDS